MIDLDQALVALADPTRRAILRRLSKGDARVTEIAAPFSISQYPAHSRVANSQISPLTSEGRIRAALRQSRIVVSPTMFRGEWLVIPANITSLRPA